MTSWFTDQAAQPREPVEAATAPPAGIVPRLASARRAVDWPELRPGASPVADEPVSVLVPLPMARHLDEIDLSFDEDDLTRVAAAVSAAARKDVREVLAASYEKRRADALAALAPVVRDALHQRAADRDRLARHLAAIVGAIAAAFAGSAAGAAGMALRAAMAELLAMQPDATVLKVSAAPVTADELRMIVPDLMQATDEAIAVEIAANPSLPEHMVQAAWSEGWVEYVPTELHRRIDELLKAYLTPTVEDAGHLRRDDQDSLAEQG